jgi:hypothetical protein
MVFLVDRLRPIRLCGYGCPNSRRRSDAAIVVHAYPSRLGWSNLAPESCVLELAPAEDNLLSYGTEVGA